MANTIYTPTSVITKYCHDNDYTITDMSLEFCGAQNVKAWVEEKDGTTSILCVQHTPTMFEIFGYVANYTETFRTSFDFADVNTPPLVPNLAYTF